MNQRTPVPFVRTRSAARRLLWLILPALLLTLLPRVGPATAWATVAADAPALFVTQFVDGLALDGTTLFWKSACGGEFAPARSRLSSSPTNAAARHDLYYPATCQADQVASASVAVDATYVYWLAGDGWVVRLPRAASTGAAPERLVRMAQGYAGGTPSCCAIAVDSSYVFWTESNKLYRAPKSGGAPRLILTGSTAVLWYLRAGGDGTLFYMDGQTLRVLLPFVDDTYLSAFVASSVGAYAIDSARVYYSVSSTSATVVSSKRRSDLSDLRLHYIAPATDVKRIDNLALDTNNLYWHEVRPTSGGYVRRQPLAGGTAVPITSYIGMASAIVGAPMLTDGQYLFWTDYNTGIYRLPVGAAPTPPPGDVWVTGMELTQATQTADGQVPLIGGKRTVVRVYVQSSADSAGPWSGVTAQLTVSGSTRVYWPANRHTITVPTAGSSRNTLDDSFAFVLDPADSATGVRDLTVTLLPPAGRPEANTANNRYTRLGVRFVARIDASVYGLLTSRADLAGGAAPPWSDFELHRQFTENAFPVARFSIVPLPGVGYRPPREAPFANLDDQDAWAQRFLGRLPAGSRINALDNVDTCACGYARGAYSIQQDNRTAPTAPGSTMAQEVAHTEGLWWHTFDPAPFPRRDDSIGPDTGMKTTSYDIPALGAGLQAIPPIASGSITPDYMSYNLSRPNWTSQFTYCTLMDGLSGGAVHCPSGVEGGRAGAIAGASALRAAGALAAVESDYLYVAGQIFPNNAGASFAPFEVISRAQDISSWIPGNTYSLVVEDAGGATLASYSFDVKHTHPRHDQPEQFSLVIPRSPGAARVSLYAGKQLLAQRDASKSAPTVAFTTQLGGAPLAGEQPLAWDAADGDGDALIYSVEYSPDGGASWLPVAVGLKDPATKVDFDSLPGSDQALLRVIASDGFSSGVATSASLKVARHKPLPAIGGAHDGAKYAAGQLVSLSGSAFDWEDGEITGAKSFTWSSDRDGLLGNGPWLDTQLSPGAHTITLTARDADGNSAATTLRVSVAGLPGQQQLFLPLVVR
jgi:hypothetical protein